MVQKTTHPVHRRIKFSQQRRIGQTPRAFAARRQARTYASSAGLPFVAFHVNFCDEGTNFTRASQSMSNHRKLEPAETGSWNYIVVLDRRSRAVGKLRHCADHDPPIWSWHIVVKDVLFANGTAFTLRSAKAAIQLAWKGHAAMVRARRPANPRRKRRDDAGAERPPGSSTRLP
jgi:hypothetical protein